MDANVIDSDWISTKEAMDLVEYSQEYIRQLARGNKIVSTKIGAVVMISKRSLLEYYKKQEERKE